METTPILVQLSPRRYYVLTTGGHSIHQQFIGASPTGKFFKRINGEIRCVGTYNECIAWIEENSTSVPRPS